MEKAVKEYVLKHYPRIFKNKPIIVEEREKVFFVSTNIDASPLILSKDILK